MSVDVNSVCNDAIVNCLERFWINDAISNAENHFEDKGYDISVYYDNIDNFWGHCSGTIQFSVEVGDESHEVSIEFEWSDDCFDINQELIDAIEDLI